MRLVEEALGQRVTLIDRGLNRYRNNSKACLSEFPDTLLNAVWEHCFQLVKNKRLNNSFMGRNNRYLKECSDFPETLPDGKACAFRHFYKQHCTEDKHE